MLEVDTSKLSTVDIVAYILNTFIKFKEII